METEESTTTESKDTTTKKQKRPIKRSVEAMARRNEKSRKHREDRRREEWREERSNREGCCSQPFNGEQRLSTHLDPTTPQNTHRSGPTFNVEVTPTVGPPTEEVRRKIMGFLALRIAEMPLTETTVPVSLRDSRIVGGRILLVCDDEGSQGVVTELLGTRDDFTVGTGPVLRRYAFGGPGYLTSLTGRQIVQFLQHQNPDLPPDSLTFVSNVDEHGGSQSNSVCRCQHLPR